MSVTIASLRTHGVRQLLVYCNGKREGDWPCHHQGTLPIEQFSADETLPDIQRRCRCTACGWRRAQLGILPAERLAQMLLRELAAEGTK